MVRHSTFKGFDMDFAQYTGGQINTQNISLLKQLSHLHICTRKPIEHKGKRGLIGRFSDKCGFAVLRC